MRPLKSNEDGELDPEEVQKKIRTDVLNPHVPYTGLITYENPTTNGNVLSLNYMKKIREVADEKNIPVHMDGARIFSAAAFLGKPAKEVA